MNKEKMIEFTGEQCKIFPEDSEMGMFLRETMKMLQESPCEDAISREDVIKAIDRHTFNTDDGLCLDEDISIILEELPPVTPTCKKCKWILYDYRTLMPREHGNIPNPYWRIPARYRTELRYCPYCGREIDYSEVDTEIEKRGSEE